jgi:phage FluMu protein Com
MPTKMIFCYSSLPPATITSVPIDDFASANEKLARIDMDTYYTCCGKCIFAMSGNNDKCPFCKAENRNKTDEEEIMQMMKRVEVKDANAMHQLAHYYNKGIGGLLQDQSKAIELWKQAAELGSSCLHFYLGDTYDKLVDIKNAKFHYEAAAMTGHEVARMNLGYLDYDLGNKDRAVKHITIAASGGCYRAIKALQLLFERGQVSRDVIEITLTAYNNSCAEMRSEARDTFMRLYIDHSTMGTVPTVEHAA